jgi:hypothetical protein
LICPSFSAALPHLVLNHKTNEPTYYKVDPLSYMDGSDGTHFVKSQYRWADRG